MIKKLENNNILRNVPLFPNQFLLLTMILDCREKFFLHLRLGDICITIKSEMIGAWYSATYFDPSIEVS